METKVKYKLNREEMLFLQSTNIDMYRIALGARDKMKTQKNTGTVLTKHSLRIILQTLSCFVKHFGHDIIYTCAAQCVKFFSNIGHL